MPRRASMPATGMRGPRAPRGLEQRRHSLGPRRRWGRRWSHSLEGHRGGVQRQRKNEVRKTDNQREQPENGQMVRKADPSGKCQPVAEILRNQGTETTKAEQRQNATDGNRAVVTENPQPARPG